jgi:hypothetical protein
MQVCLKFRATTGLRDGTFRPSADSSKSKVYQPTVTACKAISTSPGFVPVEERWKTVLESMKFSLGFPFRKLLSPLLPWLSWSDQPNHLQHLMSESSSSIPARVGRGFPLLQLELTVLVLLQ